MNSTDTLQCQPCFNVNNSIQFNSHAFIVSCTATPQGLLLQIINKNTLETCKNPRPTSGPVFCLLLGVSSDYAQPITVQVTEVTCPVIGRAQPELTSSKRQKTGPGWSELTMKVMHNINYEFPHGIFFMNSKK